MNDENGFWENGYETGKEHIFDIMNLVRELEELDFWTYDFLKEELDRRRKDEKKN